MDSVGLASVLTTEAPMSAELWTTLAYGTGAAFVLSLATLTTLLWRARIDHGFLGLIFIVILIVFLVIVSFLVAAATPGWSIKLAVTLFNGILAFGSRFVSDRFLQYLESE